MSTPGSTMTSALPKCLVRSSLPQSGPVAIREGDQNLACMQEGKAGSSIEALPCNACKQEARFLTPYGLKCPEHALETAIYDEGPEQWMPIRIRPPALVDDPLIVG